MHRKLLFLIILISIQSVYFQNPAVIDNNDITDSFNQNKIDDIIPSGVPENIVENNSSSEVVQGETNSNIETNILTDQWIQGESINLQQEFPIFVSAESTDIISNTLDETILRSNSSNPSVIDSSTALYFDDTDYESTAWHISQIENITYDDSDLIKWTQTNSSNGDLTNDNSDYYFLEYDPPAPYSGGSNSFLYITITMNTYGLTSGVIAIEPRTKHYNGDITITTYGSFYDTFQPLIISFNSTYVDSSFVKLKLQYRFHESSGIDPGVFVSFERLSLYNVKKTAFDSVVLGKTLTYYNPTITDFIWEENGDMHETYDNDKATAMIDYIKIGSLGDSFNDDSNDTDDYLSWAYEFGREYRVDLKSRVSDINIVTLAKMDTYNTTYITPDVSFSKSSSYNYQSPNPDGTLFVLIRILATGSMTFNRTEIDIDINFTFKMYNTRTGIWDIIQTSLNNFSSSNYDTPQSLRNFRLYIDKIDTGRSDIRFQLRSEYKYSSETHIVHKLEIISDALGSSITFSPPMDWNYSSVIPFVMLQSNLTEYNFASNFIGIYTFTFLSGSGFGRDYIRQKQILAIEDVSSDYLSSPSFEGGSNEDWENGNPLYPYDALTLSTDTVYEGEFALRLFAPVSGTYAIVNKDILDAGEYYFSFSYYIAYGSSLKLDVYQTAWTTLKTFDTSIKNRWITEFVYFEIKGYTTGGYNLQFWTAGSDADIYLDNIKLFKASGKVETVGYNEYEMSAQFISWDGYKNPAISNQEVEFSRRIRINGTEVQSKTLTTDNNGIVSFVSATSLYQIEYEDRWWSWQNYFVTADNAQKSYFTPVSSDMFGNSELYETENSFVFSSANNTSVYYYKNDKYSGYTLDLEYVYKNMSLGDHSFSYTRIYDSSINSNLLQLPSIWYSYTYTIVEPNLTLVHYVLTNEVGIGLDANTAKIVVNGTTIYTLDQYYYPGTFLIISVFSWSNDLLYATNTTILLEEQEIILIIPIFGQEFRNNYNFDVLLTLTSKTNSNYTIYKIVPANSSIILEMFESTFNVNFSPIISNSAGTTFANATHIISYSEVDKVIEFRKGLKAVRVDLSLSAISLTVEELTWFEKNVLPPMIAIFGVTGGVGLLVAIVLLALRSFGINLFRENIIEKPVQRFGEETGFFTMSDDEDLSFSKKKKRKFKYKYKYI